MEYDNRKADSDSLRETPEEAAHAIASALEFLRNEPAAIGIRDVGILIGFARDGSMTTIRPQPGSRNVTDP